MGKSRYRGAKGGSGVLQRLINEMGPHRVYMEPFLGDGTVMRTKRPVRVNIGLDLDAQKIADAADIPGDTAASPYQLYVGDDRPPTTRLRHAAPGGRDDDGSLDLAALLP